MGSASGADDERAAGTGTLSSVCFVQGIFGNETDAQTSRPIAHF